MISFATLPELYYLASNLRQADRRELSETRQLDPEQIAIDAAASPWRFVATGKDGLPVFALGAKPAHEGVCSVWGFGTDRYKEGVAEMTSYAKQYMVPALISAGFHRAQCVVHPENASSQRWLGKLGFYAEATLRGFGSSRNDMLLYAWVLDEPDERDHNYPGA